MNFSQRWFCVMGYATALCGIISASDYHLLTNNAKWPGRLGDHLMIYIRTQWLTQEAGTRFLYRPFRGSRDLVLHDKHAKSGEWYTKQHTQFKTKMIGPGENRTSPSPSKDTLNIVQYQEDFLDMVNVGPILKLLRSYLRPKFPPPLVKHATDIYVVLQIRTGGTYEKFAVSAQYYPDKFLPIGFYIQALNIVLKTYPDKKLFAHIVTDDRKPESLAQILKKHISSKRVQWYWRQRGNAHNRHVVDDFYYLAQANVLIRSCSNLSRVAECIGKQMLVIAPAGGLRRVKGVLVIERDPQTRKVMQHTTLPLVGWKPVVTVGKNWAKTQLRPQKEKVIT